MKVEILFRARDRNAADFAPVALETIPRDRRIAVETIDAKCEVVVVYEVGVVYVNAVIIQLRVHQIDLWQLDRKPSTTICFKPII